MKVAVVNTCDAKDIKYWSGIPYHIAFMLDAMFGKEQVSYITMPLARGLLSYIRGFYVNRIRHKNYLADMDKTVLAHNKKTFEAIKAQGFDLIITFQFFMVPGLVNPKSKIIFWSDATFSNLLNFYGYVTNLPAFNIRDAHRIQQDAFDGSDGVIFTSQWAIDSALNNYRVAADRFNRIPFASNLSTSPGPEEVPVLAARRQQDILKLLFLGVDWGRKGGDMAVSVVNSLNEKGVKAVLYVAGTDVPPAHQDNEHVIAAGFINKTTPGGEQQMIEFLKQSSFLILPTLADCTPVAFSEANSYALPVVTVNTGGIPSVIVNNVNGFYFDQQVFVEEAVSAIVESWSSAERYSSLCQSSYQYYQTELSWQKLETKFRKLVHELLPDGKITAS